jgi:hypothetical protein
MYSYIVKLIHFCLSLYLIVHYDLLRLTPILPHYFLDFIHIPPLLQVLTEGVLILIFFDVIRFNYKDLVFFFTVGQGYLLTYLMFDLFSLIVVVAYGPIEVRCHSERVPINLFFS